MKLNPLGLNRLMSYDERQDVERELSVSFADIYASLDNAHHEVRLLEEYLNSLFSGERPGSGA